MNIIELNLKFFFSLISSIIIITSYYRYYSRIFIRKTKPHLYTWLIWSVTLLTATYISITSNGGYSAIVLVIASILVSGVALLSFKYGTKDITLFDTLTLILAIFAVCSWWLFDNVTVSILLVTAIEGIGFFPTLRKTFVDPASETKLFWFFASVSSVFAILAIEHYSVLTVVYLAMVGIGNFTVMLVGFTPKKESFTVNSPEPL